MGAPDPRANFFNFKCNTMDLRNDLPPVKIAVLIDKATALARNKYIYEIADYWKEYYVMNYHQSWQEVRQQRCQAPLSERLLDSSCQQP